MVDEADGDNALASRFSSSSWRASFAARHAADSPEGLALFEQHIRPLLVEQCYKCHSAQAEKVKGGLLLDSKQGIAKGGDGGAILVAGEPDKSRLIEAVRWTDPDLKMPPKKQLTPQQIQWFEAWVKMGAPDPRESAAARWRSGGGGAGAAPKHGMDLETGRKWWAFQPVKELAPPAVKDAAWVRQQDRPIHPGEAGRGGAEAVAGGGPADADPPGVSGPDRAAADVRRSRSVRQRRFAGRVREAGRPAAGFGSLRRAVGALLAGRGSLRRGQPDQRGDQSPLPVRLAVSRLGHQGDQPGRPVRPVREAATGRRRDAGHDAGRTWWRWGSSGIGPVYHKDGRLSKDVITTLYTDDWDERIDTVRAGSWG